MFAATVTAKFFLETAAYAASQAGNDPNVQVGGETILTVYNCAGEPAQPARDFGNLKAV